MMIRIIVLLLLTLNVSAQKQDYIWQFGHDSSPEPEAQVMQVDFNQPDFDVKPITLPYGHDHNNQAICDADGNLLFYTNGCAVMNRQHQVMPNGEDLNDDPWKEVFNWDQCRIGYPGNQNIHILTDPGNEDGYYIIHKPRTYDRNRIPRTILELWYSYVDLSLDGGLGDVTDKNVVLNSGFMLDSYLTPIKHADKNQWWIIQPTKSDSVYLRYLIDDEGITRHADIPAQQYFDDWYSSGLGSSRFSPDGRRYAYFNRWANLHLYDFDRSTGDLTNHQYFEIFDTPADTFDHRPGSVEWSSNSRFLYITTLDTLHQIDTWATDIQSDGIRLIDVYDGAQNPFSTNFLMMALAPDCKIYMCSTSGSNSYHVINNPNELGAKCDFVQRGIDLPSTSASADLPIHPRWRVDEDEKCDPNITTVLGNEVFYRRNLHLYPNPVQDIVTLEVPDDFRAGTIEIFDLQGVRVYHQELRQPENIIQVDLSHLTAGRYNIELYPRNNPDRVFYGEQVVIVR